MVEELKYELALDNPKNYKGFRLFQIKALKSFDDVKKGDLGGWVQSELNLSQKGNCWLYDNSMAMDNSRVTKNAKMYGNSLIYGNAKISDNTKLYNNVVVCGKSFLLGETKLYNNVEVNGNVLLHGKVKAYNNVTIMGDVKIGGNITLKGNTLFTGDMLLEGDFIIENSRDFIVFQNNTFKLTNLTYVFKDKFWCSLDYKGDTEGLLKYIEQIDYEGFIKPYINFVENIHL